MSYLNTTVKILPPSGIRRFFDLVVSAGPEVVSLGVGEPDFPTPWHVRESAMFALEKGFTSYTENVGLLELRTEIAKKYQEEASYKYDPKTEILVTNGVSEGMDLVFRSILEVGQGVLVPDPGFVCYDTLVTLAGGVPIPYNPLDVKNSLKNIPKNTKAIILNYPGNPVGNIFTKDELAFIAQKAEGLDLLVLSDEIYGGLSFEVPHESFIKIPKMVERTILFDGLSKNFSMTGFRIGWACGPAEIINAMTKIHQYSAMCSSSISQIAAIEALRRGKSEAKKMFDIFNSRRKFCIKKLKEIGVRFYEPQGAFYLFVNIEFSQMEDVSFCEKLLEEEKLAIVPGSAFGKNGRNWVRMTYAEGLANLQEAFKRFEKFYKKFDKEA
jgi:aminotransferase